jgi:hypothetical protein
VKVLWYAGACGVVVMAGVVIAAVALDRPGLLGVALAGGIALPIQVVAFALMTRAAAGTNQFLAAWVGGTLVRLLVVGGVALGLRALPELPRAPTLLGLIAFFFLMLLMEPLFLGLGGHRRMLDPRSR